MSDPAIDLLVAHGYKYNAEAGSWSKEGKQPTFATKPWVGLTDEEVENFVATLWPLAEEPVRDRLRAIEAKLKEKNT
jgi:hypothetical protein